MPSPPTSMTTRLAARLRTLARDDRGYTSETVIWIALLSALALSVGALIGPEIVDAARNIRFK
ncbi:hypothetical protein [Streptomyces rapamycinicus]|uniref:Uncharacterized protein n=2 Tax=Streptomyces rapamycinicus TaxID=1226757 RepID=A0A3L8RFK4_STRRN|nr:hypothetical protein [Streptomyces rapamycinicus]MBB4786004.1 phosphate/sulfate permease [Streptomyces rapamycinicus]RLV78534.1 hypothetical protein D3C57_109155 [Streptomyces rapamycinicus NRRL 5491]UTO66127.1 hypothetical protein LJB45_29955 [Streptomyces rapamycinicus]UTP34081.1 hypothetical protein LIV37_35090 [Streptomyces rapamycinicus NRRL 5491]